MKESLKDKIVHNGRIAQELLRSEQFLAIQEMAEAKKEALLKEVLSSTDIGDVRYKAGFIEGLDFFKSTVDQMSHRYEVLKKKN
jgi:methylphosphotriester-DNA--protein-cysteine methyltransferase